MHSLFLLHYLLKMAQLLLLLSFLLVVVAGNHETVPAQLYWNKALPNTSMPGAIKDFLHPVNVNGNGYGITGGYTAVLEKDMLSGTKVTMHFMRTTAGFAPTFIPVQTANSIPFSLSNLPSILSHFSLNPNSFKAQSIRKTLHECEMPPVDGETKYCTTSLESMVEYTISSLGTRNIIGLSTIMSREGAPSQEYTISGVKKLSASNFVACHARKYVYAVFYCHTTTGITAYQASMVGVDGTKVEAVAVCHTAIAGPDSQSYLNGLKFKPGTVPICHFLPQDHVVWSSKV